MSIISGSGPSTVSSQSYIWDTGLLAWVVWDGSLTTTSVSIGKVTVDSSALPTGAATEATLSTLLITALTAASPTAVSVGTGSGQVVAANANRKGLVLINTSTGKMSLGFGATAVLNSGITLMPSGGTFVMDPHLFSTAVVNAIAANAASNLAVQEYS